MMIKNYSKYIKEEWNLFGKEKKEEPKEEKIDWREQLKETCYTDSLSKMFNINCRGSEQEFLIFLNKVCVNRYVQYGNTKFFCSKVYLTKELDIDIVAQTYVCAEDKKGNRYFLPPVGDVHFILPKKKISSLDPYGEEIWEE